MRRQLVLITARPRSQPLLLASSETSQHAQHAQQGTSLTEREAQSRRRSCPAEMASQQPTQQLCH